jgi:hypothetical protein
MFLECPIWPHESDHDLHPKAKDRNAGFPLLSFTSMYFDSHNLDCDQLRFLAYTQQVSKKNKNQP